MGSVCSAEPAAILLEKPGKGQWVKDTRFIYAWSLVSKPLASARDAFGTNCFLLFPGPTYFRGLNAFLQYSTCMFYFKYT
jgi:hypothetical protein